MGTAPRGWRSSGRGWGQLPRPEPALCRATDARLGAQPPRKAGLGFSSRQRSPGSAWAGWLAALFPSLGSAGASLSKGIYLWEKGQALQSWRRWAASIYAGGEWEKLAELFHSLSPNPTKLLTVTRTIYRIYGALEDYILKILLLSSLRLSPIDATACLPPWR